MKDFSKTKKTTAKLPESERIIGGDADRKMINDRKNYFIKLFKTTKKDNGNKNSRY